MMECNEVHPLLGPYTLGSLDEAERASVEEHLHGCPSCQADLKEHQRIAEQLPYVPTVVEPPADLKTRLMARIEALEVGERAEEEARSLARPPVRRGGWRRVFRERPVYALAFSITAVAVVLVGWSTYQTIRVENLQDSSDEQSALVNELEDSNNRLDARVKQQWRALTLAANPNVEAVSFKGSEASPQTRGSFMVDMQENQAVMMIVDLVPPDKDEVYQVWMWDPGGALRAVGTFRTWGEGYGIWTMRGQFSSLKYRFFGVTREPEGGSTVPTAPLLIAEENPVASK